MSNKSKQEYIKLLQRTIDYSDPDRQYIGFLADKAMELASQQVLEALEKVKNQLPTQNIVTTKYGYNSKEKKFGFRIGIAEVKLAIEQIMEEYK